MEERAYWVGFNKVKGIGSVRLRGLLDFFGRLDLAWEAPADGLRAAGLPAKVVEQVLKLRSELDLDKELETIHRKGIRVMTWEDVDYPRRLREIDQPPPVLYWLGSYEPEDDWAISIVGTRRVTAYGRQVTDELASFLAHNSVTVVSGMARGVDGIAHDTAMRHGGRTLAVLGCGVDVVYPPEHRKLAERIAAQGALISDYAPGTPPDAVNFPPRNRIISGLSPATVVVEADKESGALITAEFATSQGRDVFAVPGNINQPQSRGTNMLIARGAHPMLRPQDVLEVVGMQYVQEERAARQLLPADKVEASLLRVLGTQPLHIDEIRNLSALPIEKVSATLTMMELKGMVQQVGGMNYIAVREEQADYGSDISREDNV
ncbi:MAG TPA: DNA-processing protein DprA [Anaerolineaceae bacterium]|nr:DNA-processing protein DprA [Anaerolineaceae bacterium]